MSTERPRSLDVKTQREGTLAHGLGLFARTYQLSKNWELSTKYLKNSSASRFAELVQLRLDYDEDPEATLDELKDKTGIHVTISLIARSSGDTGEAKPSQKGQLIGIVAYDTSLKDPVFMGVAKMRNNLVAVSIQVAENNINISLLPSIKTTHSHEDLLKRLINSSQ